MSTVSSPSHFQFFTLAPKRVLLSTNPANTLSLLQKLPPPLNCLKAISHDLPPSWTPLSQAFMRTHPLGLLFFSAAPPYHCAGSSSCSQTWKVRILNCTEALLDELICCYSSSYFLTISYHVQTRFSDSPELLTSEVDGSCDSSCLTIASISTSRTKYQFLLIELNNGWTFPISMNNTTSHPVNLTWKL